MAYSTPYLPSAAAKPRYSVNDGAAALGGLAGVGPVTSGYGMRQHPITGFNKMHTGIDYRAPEGTQLRSPFGGPVTSAGTAGGYGKQVTMANPGGGTTSFSHLSKTGKVGDVQTVGYSGSTGRSTGPHLHAEMTGADGQKFNPADTGLWTHQMREHAAKAGYGQQWSPSSGGLFDVPNTKPSAPPMGYAAVPMTPPPMPGVAPQAAFAPVYAGRPPMPNPGVSPAALPPQTALAPVSAGRPPMPNPGISSASMPMSKGPSIDKGKAMSTLFGPVKSPGMKKDGKSEPYKSGTKDAFTGDIAPPPAWLQWRQDLAKRRIK